MSDKPLIEYKSIFDAIQPDQNNINRHTQRGASIVNNSIRKRGLFRGIAAAGKDTDKPTVYAGNLTLEQAVEAGITEAIIVHTNGNQLVVTVRDDVSPGSAEAIALGIEDNESGKQSYNPDIDILAALAEGDNALLAELRKEDKVFGGMLEDMGGAVPDFQPVGIEEQGRLDQKKPVICPECGAEFVPKS